MSLQVCTLCASSKTKTIFNGILYSLPSSQLNPWIPWQVKLIAELSILSYKLRILSRISSKPCGTCILSFCCSQVVLPHSCESRKFFRATCSWLDDSSYRCPFLCVPFLCVHADWLFFLFSVTVTLITARSMCRGWHFVLLAAWAPQKCAETLQERWKSSSKLPIPILGRRYFRKLLNTLLWIKRQDWLNTLLILEY